MNARDRKSRAARRARLVARKWRVSAKGNPYLNVGPWNLCVFRDPGVAKGLTVAQALRVLNDPENAKDYLRLRDVLMELSRTDGLPSAKAIGQRLKTIKGRFIGGKAIQAVPYQGTQRWRVVEAPSGGFGGFRGFVSNPGAGNCADKCNTKLGDTGAKRTHQSHQSHRDELAWSDPDAPPLELFGPSGDTSP